MLERVHAGLKALSGGIIVAILAPQLVQGSLPEWAAVLLIVMVAHRTDSILLALVGVGSVSLLRGAIPMG